MPIMYVNETNAELATSFLEDFTKDCNKNTLFLLDTKEFDGFRFDCDAAEFANCIMELKKEGATQSIKRIFQGDHFYRSDTMKCPRCYRMRQECYWNSKNGYEPYVCNRCEEFLNNRDKSAATP